MLKEVELWIWLLFDNTPQLCTLISGLVTRSVLHQSMTDSNCSFLLFWIILISGRFGVDRTSILSIFTFWFFLFQLNVELSFCKFTCMWKVFINLIMFFCFPINVIWRWTGYIFFWKTLLSINLSILESIISLRFLNSSMNALFKVAHLFLKYTRLDGVNNPVASQRLNRVGVCPTVKEAVFADDWARAKNHHDVFFLLLLLFVVSCIDNKFTWWAQTCRAW